MRSTSLWLLSSMWLSSPATALPTTSETAENMVMQYHKIDLDAFALTGNTTAHALEERKQVTICGKTFNIGFDRCFSVANFGLTLALGIARAVYAHPQARSCTAEEFDTANFQYAVRAKGNCHTTAQRDTIEGAIQHYVNKEIPDTVCGAQCMELTHVGDWQG